MTIADRLIRLFAWSSDVSGSAGAGQERCWGKDHDSPGEAPCCAPASDHDASEEMEGAQSIEPASDLRTISSKSLACSDDGSISSQRLQAKLRVDFKDLVFHELIGKGSFKAVYRGKWADTRVAIVRMRKGGRVTEARVLQQLSNHPNIVQFYRWATDNEGNEYMVMEYVKLGSLDKLLQTHGYHFRTSAKLGICEQICSAMCEITNKGVLHCDLAARNILVSSMHPVHVKVTDFGLAAHKKRSPASSFSAQPAAGSTAGTPLSAPIVDTTIPIRWSPPEMLNKGQWTEKSDVWSFGVAMWEVFSNGNEPYTNMSDIEVFRAVIDGKLLSMPAECPEELYALMVDCWNPKPEDRPSFAEVSGIFKDWRGACKGPYSLQESQTQESSSEDSVEEENPVECSHDGDCSSSSSSTSGYNLEDLDNLLNQDRFSDTHSLDVVLLADQENPVLYTSSPSPQTSSTVTSPSSQYTTICQATEDCADAAVGVHHSLHLSQQRAAVQKWRMEGCDGAEECGSSKESTPSSAQAVKRHGFSNSMASTTTSGFPAMMTPPSGSSTCDSAEQSSYQSCTKQQSRAIMEGFSEDQETSCSKSTSSSQFQTNPLLSNLICVLAQGQGCAKPAPANRHPLSVMERPIFPRSSSALISDSGWTETNRLDLEPTESDRLDLVPTESDLVPNQSGLCPSFADADAPYVESDSTPMAATPVAHLPSSNSCGQLLVNPKLLPAARVPLWSLCRHIPLWHLRESRKVPHAGRETNHVPRSWRMLLQELRNSIGHVDTKDKCPNLSSISCPEGLDNSEPQYFTPAPFVQPSKHSECSVHLLTRASTASNVLPAINPTHLVPTSCTQHEYLLSAPEKPCCKELPPPQKAMPGRNVKNFSAPIRADQYCAKRRSPYVDIHTLTGAVW